MASGLVSRRRIAANGIELAYLEQGEGEPLVLIMGLGADAAAWDPHVEEYRKHFRCFAVDNRGAGESDAPAGPYSTAQMADDYAGLVHGLSLGPVRVVGISMGGAIAQELALRHPDLVARLVLVSTWDRCDAYTAEVFRHFASVRPRVSPEAFTQLLQLWIWSPGYFGAHLDELVEARESLVPAMPDHAFASQCEACITHDTRDRLGAIKVPTLITAGDVDIFTPLSFAEALHTRISQSELHVFHDAGHAHHWERQEMFNAITAWWLA